MKLVTVLAQALTGALLILVPLVTPASDDAAEGHPEPWEVMFDGESFGHWRNYGSTGPVQGWVVEDGTLFMTRDSGFIAEAIKYLFGDGTGDLIYAQQKYRDFELSLQWKVSENGNSGIFYFVADEEHDFPWQTGLEMQVLHNEGHPDGKIDKHRAGDLYDLISAEPETVKGPGQWNQVRLKVCNNRVEHWLNGVKVVSYTHGGASWDALVADSKFADMPDFGKSDEGYIVLQDHGDPVWYRNLKIREGCG